MYSTEQSKAIVLRFNKEVIEQGNIDSIHELVAGDVINHTAPPGVSMGADGMIHFLMNVLRKTFPDLKVEILEQVAERDLVTTRKKITATHKEEPVEINIIDMIRLKNG